MVVLTHSNYPLPSEGVCAFEYTYPNAPAGSYVLRGAVSSALTQGKASHIKESLFLIPGQHGLMGFLHLYAALQSQLNRRIVLGEIRFCGDIECGTALLSVHY